MSFKQQSIKNEYRSLIDNVVRDFYIPLLKKSIMYRRAVGFFSSSSLVEISKGITGLVKNGGSMQLVASPYLSEKDMEAIRTGYHRRNEIIEKALISSLREPQNHYEEMRLNLLANLIAGGKLDIKIAFVQTNKMLGMYHEKMGLLYDVEGNKIAFAGSMNESSTAMSLNYEAIDVFCSWKNESDIERVRAKENAFEAIWNNLEPNVETIDFPNIKKEILNRYKKTATIDYNGDDYEFENYMLEKTEQLYNGAFVPRHITFYEYQAEAIDEWEKRDFQGIFDMATGTGKTFTGLGGVVRLYNHAEGKLAVVIVCPYQHLVEQWVEDINIFNINPIIGYSNSSQKDWKKRLGNAILDQNLKVKNRDFFCFVCTNATFASVFVQKQISKIRGNALILVDEAHNFGSPRLRATLTVTFNYRLALSATLERHKDEEGTQQLINYFGSKCIEYPLDRAIAEKKLTPYKYYPIVVNLNERELEIYKYLSSEIGKCLVKGRNGKIKLSEKGKIIALQRARLVAAAENKIAALKEEILPYIKKTHLLVYCGAAKLLADDEDLTNVDDDELRQIEVVTRMLGNELDMKVSQFTSREDVKERVILKEEFKKGDKLQALIAIKCLDEGVNIPAIKVAFILASTTNPKEYIQRRGRVLRLAEGKEFAEIYDFITVPRPLEEVSSLTVREMNRDLSLIKNELVRAEEFARIARNSMQADYTIQMIREVYGLRDETFEFTIE